MCITESLCFTAEINTTLEINYTWVKNKRNTIWGNINRNTYLRKNIKTTTFALFLNTAISKHIYIDKKFCLSKTSSVTLSSSKAIWNYLHSTIFDPQNSNFVWFNLLMCYRFHNCGSIYEAIHSIQTTAFSCKVKFF